MSLKKEIYAEGMDLLFYYVSQSELCLANDYLKSISI